MNLEAQHRQDQALALHHTITERGKRHRHEEHHTTHALTTEKAPIVRDIATEGLNKREATQVISDQAIIAGQQGVIKPKSKTATLPIRRPPLRKEELVVLGSSKTTTTQTMATQSRGPVVGSVYAPHQRYRYLCCPRRKYSSATIDLRSECPRPTHGWGDIYFKTGKGPSLKRRSPKKKAWSGTQPLKIKKAIPSPKV